jgi:hypothetical protein
VAASLAREIRRLVAKWRKHLDISNQWRIEITIHDRPGERDTDDAQACISVSPQYMHASLEVNAWQCDGVDLDEVIAHEMLHVVLKPVETIVESAMGERFAELGEQHLEGLVERLTRALVRLERAKPARR